MDLVSDFGDVGIYEAIEARPTVSTKNGEIFFSGSLDPKAKSIFETDFGDVELHLPADSAFEVELETNFGGVISELPILTSGEIAGGEGTRRIGGRLGDGGPLLRAKTQSGTIRILPLDSGAEIDL